MSHLTEGFVAIALVVVALIALIILRPSLTEARGGRILAFLSLFILPLLVTAFGVSAQVEHSAIALLCKSRTKRWTGFCRWQC